MDNPREDRHRSCPSLLLSGLILELPGRPQRTEPGTDSVQDQWNVAGNWTPNGVPIERGQRRHHQYHRQHPVQISGINPTIANLTLGTVATSNSADPRQ